MIKVSLNSSCTITFTFELILLGKEWNPLIHLAIDLIVSLLFYNDGFGIK